MQIWEFYKTSAIVYKQYDQQSAVEHQIRQQFRTKAYISCYGASISTQMYYCINKHLSPLVSLRQLYISINSPMQFNRALVSIFISYSAKHKIAILTFSTEVIHNIIKKEFKTNLSLFAVWMVIKTCTYTRQCL